MPPTTVHQPFTVLLIEDNGDDERLALRALRGCGLPVLVRVARDGQRALEKLGLDGSVPEGDRWVPDLVVSDFKMPRMSGDEALRAARQDPRLRRVPYVILSSSSEPRDVERCRDLGASAYATKPVDYEGYLDRVKAIAHEWLGESPAAGFHVLGGAETPRLAAAL